MQSNDVVFGIKRNKKHVTFIRIDMRHPFRLPHSPAFSHAANVQCIAKNRCSTAGRRRHIATSLQHHRRRVDRNRAYRPTSGELLYTATNALALRPNRREHIISDRLFSLALLCEISAQFFHRMSVTWRKVSLWCMCQSNCTTYRAVRLSLAVRGG